MSGSSDEGGIDNHAQTTIAQADSVSLQIDKLDGNPLRFDLWYPAADRYDVTIQSPAGTSGPYSAPATNSATDQKTTGIAGVSFYGHYGNTATPFGSVTRREILIDFNGPAGRYVVTLRATVATGAKFDA